MPTKDDVLEVGVGILAIRETTQGIRKALGKEVKRDKKASKKKQGFLRTMFMRKKKEDAEKMIEGKKKKNFMGKGVTAVASAGKSFLERLFGASAALLVGFLVIQLPKIIEEIEKVFEWLKNVKEWVQNFIDKVKKVSDVIITTVKEWISNMKETFGFEKKKDEIEQKMDELNKTASTLERDWADDQERLKKDLEKAEKEGKRSVEGLPSSQTDIVEESDTRQNEITALQERRESGDITQSQYETEVGKLYEAEETNTNYFQTLDNQIDRNTMSPAEFFGTNEYGDGGDGVNDKINTNVEGFDDKINLDEKVEKENKDLSLENNNGGVNFVSTQKNSDTLKEETKPKVVVYQKFGKTMKFQPPGIGVDGLTKEEAKTRFLALHNKHPDLSFDEEHDYESLEIVLHDKFNVNTSAIQVEASEDFIKSMKSRYKPDEMNLISPTGGKTIVVPIDTSKTKINNGKTMVTGSSEEGKIDTVIVSANPIKKINQFNRHFV